MEKIKNFWIWFDDTNIDLWIISTFILWGTWRLTEWAMWFANAPHDDSSSSGIAMIIAAVTAPYLALQTAAISFLFKART